MPLKFNFVNRQDICKEIKELNNQWKSVESDAISKLAAYSDLFNNLQLMRKQIEELNKWIKQYKQLKGDFEQHYLDKMMDGLMVYEKDLQVQLSIMYILFLKIDINYSHHFHSSTFSFFILQTFPPISILVHFEASTKPKKTVG